MAVKHGIGKVAVREFEINSAAQLLDMVVFFVFIVGILLLNDRLLRFSFSLVELHLSL